MTYCVYILKSEKTGRLYIGQTKNLEERLKRHNQGRTRFAKIERPWRVIHAEKYPTRLEAVKRENYLKSLKNRKFLEEKIIGKRRGVEE